RTLGGGERAVGLEVGEVGAVRGGDAGEVLRQAFGGEGGRDRFAESRLQVAHWSGVLAACWPTLTRKRLQSRLKAAICGVTSKPTRTSSCEPEPAIPARGMVMLPMVSVT